MAGWGIGFGGFVQGLEQGIKTRQSMDAARQEKQLRNQEIEANNIKLQQAHREQLQQSTLDSVGQHYAQLYRQAAAADPEIEKHPGEWWAKNAVPGVKQVLLSMGRADDAAKFDKWVKDENNQRLMRHKAELFTKIGVAAQTGDWKPVSAAMKKFYNDLPDEFRNGSTFERLDVTDADKANVKLRGNGRVSDAFADLHGGKQAPYSIVPVFKTKDGKEFTMPFHDAKTFRDQFDMAFNPVSAWQRQEGQLAEGEKLKEEQGKEAAKEGEKLKEKEEERRLGIGTSPDERIASDIYKNATLLGQQVTPEQIAQGVRTIKRGLQMANTPQLETEQPQTQQPANPNAAAPKGAAVKKPPLSEGPPSVTAPRPADQASDDSAPTTVPGQVNPGVVDVPGVGTVPGTPMSRLGIATQTASKQLGVTPPAARATPQLVSQINAARRSRGLPPVTPDQVAAMMGQ